MKMEYDTNSNYLAAFYQDSDNGVRKFKLFK